mgnify:CR=1 FL=1
MKLNKIITGIITGGSILAITLIASANNSSTIATNNNTRTTNPMVIEIGPRGGTLLRGTVISNASGSLVVKSWGGNWTINIGSSTKILPNKDIANFAKDDFVGIQGKISDSSPWTINATLIRNWSYKEELAKTKKENKEVVKELMKNATPRNYEGKVTTITGSGFTLTEKNVAFSVSIVSGAKIFNKNYLPILISDIQSGDTLRVWGTNVSSTISAQIVRDISIPRTATSSSH